MLIKSTHCIIHRNNQLSCNSKVPLKVCQHHSAIKMSFYKSIFSFPKQYMIYCLTIACKMHLWIYTHMYQLALLVITCDNYKCFKSWNKFDTLQKMCYTINTTELTREEKTQINVTSFDNSNMYFVLRLNFACKAGDFAQVCFCCSTSCKEV